MDELPDLDRLSVAAKDELIRVLFAQVNALAAQVEALTTKVAELEGRLAKNSRNSSKPPSPDGLNRSKPKSQREAGQKPTGGQNGYASHTLKKAEEVDHIETHAPPKRCDACGGSLTNAVVVEARQVFDIPPLSHEVTEHQLPEAVCSCGKAHRGEFPAGVSAPVQYGPRLKAAVVHLTHHHMMPVSRTGDLMGDLFGLPLSDATVLAINGAARTILAPTVMAMGEVDWALVRQVLAELERMLAVSSVLANQIVETHGALLKAALGPLGAELEQRVEHFLYPEALETVTQARREYAELAAL